MGANYGCGKCLPDDSSRIPDSARDASVHIDENIIPVSHNKTVKLKMISEEALLDKVKADRATSRGSIKAANNNADPLTLSRDNSVDLVKKFHSALRWGKPWLEINRLIGDSNMKDLCNEQDPQNGNTALHVATQNNHLQLVQNLVHAGANVNVQNSKGQTALHMSVGYDMYFVVTFLLDNGADGQVENADGHKAISGIDGSKVGKDVWYNPVNAIRDAKTKEQVDFAFLELEKALVTNGVLIDKGILVQVGMFKKKDASMNGIWDHNKFMAFVANF